MSHAAQAYARTSQTTAPPREIEAPALLEAASACPGVPGTSGRPDENNDTPQPLEIRQNIANIGVFVMKQTIEMQLNPDPAKLKSLIDINCNLAAGLSGRV